MPGPAQLSAPLVKGREGTERFREGPIVKRLARLAPRRVPAAPLRDLAKAVLCSTGSEAWSLATSGIGSTSRAESRSHLRYGLKRAPHWLDPPREGNARSDPHPRGNTRSLPRFGGEPAWKRLRGQESPGTSWPGWPVQPRTSTSGKS